MVAALRMVRSLDEDITIWLLMVEAPTFDEFIDADVGGMDQREEVGDDMLYMI